jgi:small nuclear ribonucleoprotein (snRNP)-like protein
LISRRMREEDDERGQAQSQGQNKNNSYETPLKLLKKALNAPITVKLKDGQEYRGILNNYDPTMNIVLDDSVQIDDDGNAMVSFGRILIRGNNILYIVVNGGSSKSAQRSTRKLI